MNLAAYVKNGKFDYENFSLDVKVALRLLDNVIDQTYYFFKENEKCAKDIRRTGLGIMGIGDALIKMKIRYGSKESLPVIRKIFETLRNSAYDESCDLAKEKGTFPKFNKAKYLKGYHIKNLPQSLQKKIAKQGIRNAVLLTIAPTGTTSLVSGVSSGIEPVYEFVFKRKDRMGEHMMYHPLYEEWKKVNPNTEKPAYFASANDLTPLEHAQVQAVAQEYIDSSISKTVNAPNSHTVDDVKNLYMAAYDLGLKGVTYMRDGSREGVLERVVEKKEEPKVETPVKWQPKPVVPRPMSLSGVTYKMETPVGHTYITINHNEQEEPFEIFMTIGKVGSDVAAMADALGRMISLNLRLTDGLSPRERIKQVVAQMIGIGGARSVGFGKDRVRSLPDAIAKVLSMHYGFALNGKVEDKPLTNGHADNNLTNGHSNGQTPQVAEAKPEIVAMQQLAIDGKSATVLDTSTSLYDLCPECGGGSLAYEEGCKKCYACGYSEC
jgi:ribonucleoside-diphosphate reductase alpha chain